MRAVVMGGSSGIGLATANQFASTGMDVTVTGRDKTKLATLNGQLTAERLDGTDHAAVTAFFDEFGEFERLVLAFSPGAGAFGPIREIEFARIEEAFTGKIFAYLHAIRTANVTNSITMVAAASARAAVPGTVALAAANGAIERAVSPSPRNSRPSESTSSAPVSLTHHGGHSSPRTNARNSSRVSERASQLANRPAMRACAQSECVSSAIGVRVGE